MNGAMDSQSEAGLALVREALTDVYTASGIDIWLTSANRNLGGRVPEQMLAAGDVDAVVAEAHRVGHHEPS